MNIPFRRLAARVAVLAFAWTAEAAAQPARPPCEPGELRAQLATNPPRASIAGGRVSLMPPPGLSARPPDGAYEIVLAGPDGTVVLAWSSKWAPDPGSPESSKLLSEYIELRSPEIEWIRRDTVEISGTRWLRFEYTRRIAGEYVLYEQHYATAFQGRGVHVRMTTNAVNEPRRAELMASAATLQVRDCALPEDSAAPAPPPAAPGTCDRGQLRSYPDPAAPRRVETSGGVISLVVPEGMRARSIPRRPNAASWTPLAFSDDAGTFITVMTGPPLGPVESLADAMATGMASNIGEVIRKDVVEQGGTRWARLEFTGQLGGERIYNLQYMASFGNRGFVVAFRTRADTPEARARLAASAATLEMENCVENRPASP
ncbi:MAG: hypothetical protein ACJ8J0_26850 [Longimicrobiaceae bacterium]